MHALSQHVPDLSFFLSCVTRCIWVCLVFMCSESCPAWALLHRCDLAQSFRWSVIGSLYTSHVSPFCSYYSSTTEKLLISMVPFGDASMRVFLCMEGLRLDWNQAKPHQMAKLALAMLVFVLFFILGLTILGIFFDQWLQGVGSPWLLLKGKNFPFVNAFWVTENPYASHLFYFVLAVEGF